MEIKLADIPLFDSRYPVPEDIKQEWVDRMLTLKEGTNYTLSGDTIIIVNFSKNMVTVIEAEVRKYKTTTL